MALRGMKKIADLESFSFGDSPAAADECLELVLIGRKTATCWAASEGLKGAEVGKRWIVKDGQGRPRAIVETVELTRRRFDEADEALAYHGAKATGRSNIGGSCIRTILPGKARFRRTWSSIANGSGSLKSSTATDECGERSTRKLASPTSSIKATAAALRSIDCFAPRAGLGSDPGAPLSRL